LKSLSELDAELGMDVLVSESLPCSARLRASDEDFKVDEVISLDLVNSPKPGYFPVYRVEKRSIDTMHMERELSKALGSKISYGGLKDKRAVAVQYVTPTSARAAVPSNVRRPGFTAELVGYVPAPISRGSVSGNRFEVTLRECCPSIEENLTEAFELAALGRLPNYFGYQRFGIYGAGTHRIGRAIVRRRFDEAVELMLSGKSGGVGGGSKGEPGSDVPEEGWQLSPGQDLERVVASRLEMKPGDYIGALRGLPTKVRRLYVQAYQSYIFNRAISLAIFEGLDISSAQLGDNWSELQQGGSPSPAVRSVREPPPAGAAPMVQLAGYAYRDYGSRFDAVTSKAMGEENVAAKDFYIKEMQEVSAEGGFRIPHLVVNDRSFKKSGRVAVLNFRLGRGQYATVLLREIIKPSDPRECGLA
jgi:tRNA pseudouridine13 synthase